MNKSLQVNQLKPGAYLERAVAYHRKGQLAEAEALYREILRLWPYQPDALALLGLIAHSVKNYSAALQLFDRAVLINPRNPAVFNNRGVTFLAMGNKPEALKCFEQAIAIEPNYADAHSNRGIALNDLERYGEALASYDTAISLNADFADAYCNRAATHYAMGQFEAALEDSQKAIRLNPYKVESYLNCGTAQGAMKKFNDALVSYRDAIALKPNYAPAYACRALAFHELDRNREAIENCNKSIILDPTSVQAHTNRAAIFTALREYPLALESARQALLLDQNRKYQAGVALCAQRNLCEWEGTESALMKIEHDVDADKHMIGPFDYVVFGGSASRQRKVAELFVNDMYRPTSANDEVSERKRGGKIKIGYFSSDFYDHATTYLMAQLFELHDKNKFDIYGFSFGQDADDAMRRRTAAAMTEFIDVRFMSNHDVAGLSRRIGIDIAVDLKGFTGGNRFGIFVEHAAPVQVSYLGYPGTTGSACMDYLIADHTLIPEGSQKHYSEKIIYLPNSYQVNDTKRFISSEHIVRADVGLPEHDIVYCCFNNSYKITPNVFDAWMRILKRVEGSVLWLLERNRWVRENLRKEAMLRGITPERLVLHLPCRWKNIWHVTDWPICFSTPCHAMPTLPPVMHYGQGYPYSHASEKRLQAESQQVCFRL